jgi:replication factor C subunit 3/5
LALQNDRCLSLSDILEQVYQHVAGLEMPDQSKMYLIDELATIEYNLSVGTVERIQLAALVGAFKIAIDMSAK